MKKKILCLLLALLMLLSLAACGAKKPSVVGVWEADLDMRDQMVEEMDASVGVDLSFGEYLDSFIWTVTLELNKDGTYSLKYDLGKDMDHFVDAVVKYMRDAIIQQAGMEVSDELIAQALGMSLEDYAKMVADQMTEAAAAESGKYKDDGKKLTWENGEESPYELTEDTLSFSVVNLGELNFKRIG